MCLVLNPACLAEEQIDINTATYEEIARGCAISTDQAKQIEEYRDTHGPFSSIEKLTKVFCISLNKFNEIKSRIKVSDNLRCWNCGTVFKELKDHTNGICPSCKKKWPAESKDMIQGKITDRDSKQSGDELPVKIGDQSTKVIDHFGEPTRKGYSVMGSMDKRQKELYGLIVYYYIDKGLAFNFMRDRIWKIEAKEPYNGTLLSIHIGDGKDDIIQKHGKRYRMARGLTYLNLRGCQVQFNLDQASEKVNRIYVSDKNIYDMLLKKVRKRRSRR